MTDLLRSGGLAPGPAPAPGPVCGSLSPAPLPPPVRPTVSPCRQDAKLVLSSSPSPRLALPQPAVACTPPGLRGLRGPAGQPARPQRRRTSNGPRASSAIRATRAATESSTPTRFIRRTIVEAQEDRAHPGRHGAQRHDPAASAVGEARTRQRNSGHRPPRQRPCDGNCRPPTAPDRTRSTTQNGSRRQPRPLQRSGPGVRHAASRSEWPLAHSTNRRSLEPPQRQRLKCDGRRVDRRRR